MHRWINGWDWVWMSALMSFWLVIIGGLVYSVVAWLGRRQEHGRPS